MVYRAHWSLACVHVKIAPLLWCPFVLCRGRGLDMLRQRGAEVNLQKSDGVTARADARCAQSHRPVERHSSRDRAWATKSRWGPVRPARFVARYGSGIEAPEGPVVPRAAARTARAIRR